jgi:hypothetical protein
MELLVLFLGGWFLGFLFFLFKGEIGLIIYFEALLLGASSELFYFPLFIMSSDCFNIHFSIVKIAMIFLFCLHIFPVPLLASFLYAFVLEIYLLNRI